jgi:hypothetical protein
MCVIIRVKNFLSEHLVLNSEDKEFWSRVEARRKAFEEAIRIKKPPRRVPRYGEPIWLDWDAQPDPRVPFTLAEIAVFSRLLRGKRFKRGRPCIGEKPMSGAERARRAYAKRKSKEAEKAQ